MSDSSDGRSKEERIREIHLLRAFASPEDIARMSVAATFEDTDPVDPIEARRAEMLLVSGGFDLQKMSTTFEIPIEQLGELVVRSARLQKENLADWILETIEEAKIIGWDIMATEKPDSSDAGDTIH